MFKTRAKGEFKPPISSGPKLLRALSDLDNARTSSPESQTPAQLNFSWDSSRFSLVKPTLADGLSFSFTTG